MNLNALRAHKFFRPGVGACLAILCGLVLCFTRLGDSWVNGSYDYFFLLSSSVPTNEIALILMDNPSYATLHQTRGQPWDRALHADLLNKLADDGCPLVVFDVIFKEPKDPTKDAALAQALSRQKNVVLAAKLTSISQSSRSENGLESATLVPPFEMLLRAARTNWGVILSDPDLDGIVRRHWPFPAPSSYPSIAWTAAALARAKLPVKEEKQWLRYHVPHPAATRLSYQLARDKPAHYFRNKIVFIGNEPETAITGREKDDEFRTPYTRWTGETVGGIEIHATAFLNLMNQDWLQRTVWPAELAILLLTGLIFGAGLCLLRPLLVVCAAVIAVLFVIVGYPFFVNHTNIWFPWLVIVGAQLPCSVGWSVLTGKSAAKPVLSPTITVRLPESLSVGRQECTPDTPDYELVEPPFGEGAFGKVWLARNAIGQWQALKAVYRSKFSSDFPYDTEFEGIKHYKPVSEKHSGLLRIEFISAKKQEGYFYYVMERADARQPDWETNPVLYKPVTLECARSQSPHSRLPVANCIDIGITLAGTLDFLHRNNLTHRDIKPSNVIFVNGNVKLADVGLVTDARSPNSDATRVGTPGYMPPAPEPQGTKQADIYALGMLLYVISTGRQPEFFPELSSTLLERTDHDDFMKLDSVILRACQPKPLQRYSSVEEMTQALRALKGC